VDTNVSPVRVVSPGRIIRRELEARGWTQKDLAEIIKRPEKTISQIMSGHKQITPETALELGAAFGTSAELWLNLEANYRLHQAEKEHNTTGIERKSRLYGMLPIAEMLKRGWLHTSESIEALEREVCAFLGIASLGEQPRPAASFRQSQGQKPEVEAEVAWIRRVEHLALAQRVEAFNPDWENALQDLLALSGAPEHAAQVPPLLMGLGVHLLVVPHLPHTYLDGTAFALAGHPVIALTLRHDRIDNFWFSLLHELAHIVAGHEGGYLDNLEAETRVPEETEANRMARDWLIAPQAFQSFVEATRPYFSKAKVCAFAERLGRHPGIVVGRLQHDQHISYGTLRALQVSVRDHLLPWIDGEAIPTVPRRVVAHLGNS